MPIDLNRLQTRLRRISWIVAALCLLYLYTRYDTLTLPADGCSPLVRFGPGDTLLLDRRPEGYAINDALLFVSQEDGEQSLRLAKVQRVTPEGSERGQAEQLWVSTDAKNCPGEDSSTLGWIDRDQCRARVLFAWPW